MQIIPTAMARLFHATFFGFGSVGFVSSTFVSLILGPQVCPWLLCRLKISVLEVSA
jgi:hypothetical protein